MGVNFAVNLSMAKVQKQAHMLQTRTATNCHSNSVPPPPAESVRAAVQCSTTQVLTVDGSSHWSSENTCENICLKTHAQARPTAHKDREGAAVTHTSQRPAGTKSLRGVSQLAQLLPRFERSQPTV